MIRALSIIALENRETDGVTIYESERPKVTGKNRVGISFGKVQIVSSVKNMLVKDENGEKLYMFLKTGENDFSLRYRDPLSLLVGFGTACCIFSSTK